MADVVRALLAAVVLALAALFVASSAHAVGVPSKTPSILAGREDITSPDAKTRYCSSDLVLNAAAGKACWGCEFVGNFMYIGTMVAKATYGNIATAAKPFIQYFFSIWLAVAMIKIMFYGGDARSAVDVAFKLFLVLIITWALDWGRDSVLEGIFMIAYGIPAELSRTALEAVKGVDSGLGGLIGQIINAGSEGVTAPAFGNATLDQAGKAMVEMVWAFQRIIMVAGHTMWVPVQYAYQSAGILNAPAVLIAFITALVLFILAGLPLFVSLIAMIFFMVDLIFKVTIITALMPIFILFGLWRPAQGVLAAMLRGLISSGLTLIAGSIVYSIIAGFVAYTPRVSGVGDTFEDMCVKILENANNAFTVATAGFWWLVMAGVLGTLALGKAKEIVGAIVGSADGQGMGEMAAGVVSGFAKYAAGGAAAGAVTQIIKSPAVMARLTGTGMVGLQGAGVGHAISVAGMAGNAGAAGATMASAAGATAGSGIGGLAGAAGATSAAAGGTSFFDPFAGGDGNASAKAGGVSAPKPASAPENATLTRLADKSGADIIKAYEERQATGATSAAASGTSFFDPFAGGGSASAKAGGVSAPESASSPEDAARADAQFRRLTDTSSDEFAQRLGESRPAAGESIGAPLRPSVSAAGGASEPPAPDRARQDEEWKRRFGLSRDEVMKRFEEGGLLRHPDENQGEKP